MVSDNCHFGFNHSLGAPNIKYTVYELFILWFYGFRYSDDPSLKIEKLDNAYKLAREKLATQTKVVEDIKKVGYTLSH